MELISAWIPIKDYASLKRTSVQNIYQQIKRGTLASQKKKGKMYVFDDMAFIDESQYLTVRQFSKKYKISISAIRERIKREEIDYIRGRSYYLILDKGIQLKYNKSN